MIKKDYEPIYEYKDNQYYKLFQEEKDQLKSKYPQEIFYKPISGRDTSKECKKYIELGYRELHKEYLKELSDLIFKPDGTYQQFTWDIMPEVDKLEMEKKARGRFYSSDYLGE